MTAVDDKIRLFEATKQQHLKKLRLARTLAPLIRTDMLRDRPRPSLLPAAASSVALALACRSLLLAPLLLYPLQQLMK